MTNLVYIATSIDGYISDQDGGVEWLHSTPNPNNNDFGWADLMARVDALIMGRNTFTTVCNFDCPWPYAKPVFVLSNSMTQVPKGYEDKIELVKGPLPTIVSSLNARGYETIYIDGGKTIQSFLAQDLVDEMTITKIPLLIGRGTPLFGDLDVPLVFEHVQTKVFLDAIVQTTWRRKR